MELTLRLLKGSLRVDWPTAWATLGGSHFAPKSRFGTAHGISRYVIAIRKCDCHEPLGEGCVLGEPGSDADPAVNPKSIRPGISAQIRANRAGPPRRPTGVRGSRRRLALAPPDALPLRRRSSPRSRSDSEAPLSQQVPTLTSRNGHPLDSDW
jgi:hypothetical protein